MQAGSSSIYSLRHRGERGAVLVLICIIISVLIVFFVFAVDLAYLGAARLQQRGSAEYIALTTLHAHIERNLPASDPSLITLYPSIFFSEMNMRIRFGEQIGKYPILGLTTNQIIYTGELMYNVQTGFPMTETGSVTFGTVNYFSGFFFPTPNWSGVNAVRVELRLRSAESMILPALQLLGWSASPIFKSQAVAAYDPLAAPGRRYRIAD